VWGGGGYWGVRREGGGGDKVCMFSVLQMCVCAHCVFSP
jgi:hypothetical protein